MKTFEEYMEHATYVYEKLLYSTKYHRDEDAEAYARLVEQATNMMWAVIAKEDRDRYGS